MFDSWPTANRLQTRIATIISFVLLTVLLVVLSASCTPETTSTPPILGAHLLG
jgi:hypothetical protein